MRWSGRGLATRLRMQRLRKWSRKHFIPSCSVSLILCRMVCWCVCTSELWRKAIIKYGYNTLKFAVDKIKIAFFFRHGLDKFRHYITLHLHPVYRIFVSWNQIVGLIVNVHLFSMAILWPCWCPFSMNCGGLMLISEASIPLSKWCILHIIPISIKFINFPLFSFNLRSLFWLNLRIFPSPVLTIMHLRIMLCTYWTQAFLFETEHFWPG